MLRKLVHALHKHTHILCSVFRVGLAVTGDILRLELSATGEDTGLSDRPGVAVYHHQLKVKCEIK